MEDIVIDEKTPVSIKMVKQKRGRSWGAFLVDWVEKALIVGLLLAIDFTLFAGGGSFKIFPSQNSLTLEVVYILSGIFIFSFVLMYLVSFSSFLQNVLTAVIVGVFAVVFVNQFANFDKHSMFAGFAEAYLGHDMGLLMTSFSHVFLGVVVGLIFFIYLVSTNKQGIAYFVGVLFLVFVGVAFHEYTLWGTKDAYAVYDNMLKEKSVPADTSQDKRFVYIAVPELTSYGYMNDLKNSKVADAAVNKELDATRDVMLGFYIRNGYKYFANAYINDYDPFYNMAETFNIGSNKNVQELLQNKVIAQDLWRFHNLMPKYVYLKENRLFDIFNRSGYDVKAYQSQGIEMCREDGEVNVNKCVEKQGIPVGLEKTNYSIEARTAVLLAEWIESMGLTDGFPLLYKLLKTFMDVDGAPMLGISYKDIYVIDSLQALDILAKDIAADKGNKAYFVYIDIPKMYVYDEFCQLKPLEAWKTKDALPWVGVQDNFEKRSVYAEQTRCLYGKLEEFMQSLRKNNLFDRTVVVLQGVVGVDGLGKGNANDFVNTTKNEKLVTMAIRDPFKNKFELDYEICSAPNILKKYLYKKTDCTDSKMMNLHPDALNILKQSILENKITVENVKTAQQNFAPWYEKWAKANKVEALPVAAGEAEVVSEALPEAPETTTEIKKAEVKPVDAQSDVPEAQTKNLVQEMQKSGKKQEDSAKSAAKPKETVEKVEIKVIEN